jgi:hypothetical protein
VLDGRALTELGGAEENADGEADKLNWLSLSPAACLFLKRVTATEEEESKNK